MHSEHIHLWGFIKTFQLNSWLKSLFVKCLWLTVNWNWWWFWDSKSWMLYFLHNRIERTFAFTAAGVGTFWLANSKKFLFRLTTKILLYSWMVSFMFLLWHCLLKIPIQESKWIKSGKGLACWKRLTPWKRLIQSVNYYVMSVFLMSFRDPNRVHRIRENYQQVTKIRENRPLNQRNQVHTG